MARFSQFIASRKFLSVILGLFVLQSLWIALTARYPQAFDEQVHFGLIQLHAHSWLPYFTNQPTTADAYGAVIRDPSYLYHYLFSLPYRLLALFTSNEVVQVIVLRCLNIALFTSALLVYRRVLRRMSLSSAATNLVILLVVITPVAPALASQINYDNLSILLAGLLVLACLRVQRYLQLGQPVSLYDWTIIIVISLLGCLVKYPFLPLAAVALSFSVVQFWRHRKRWQRPSFNWKTACLLIVCLLSLCLFTERYGINLVRYHSLTPECDQVLSIKRCSAYSPWLRNYYFAQQNDAPTVKEIASYPGSWLGRMVEESLFAIGSGFNKGVNIATSQYGTVDYWSGHSLPVPRFMTIGALIIGLIAIGANARRLVANRAVLLAGLFTIVYAGSLFLLNLSDFLHIGVVTAVHGRYLILVLPLLYGIAVLAIQQSLQQKALNRLLPHRRQLVVTAVLLVLFVSQGGGIVTYIVRSQPRWFWPQTSAAQSLNSQAQRTLKPIVIGSNSSK